MKLPTSQLVRELSYFETQASLKLHKHVLIYSTKPSNTIFLTPGNNHKNANFVNFAL